MKCESCLTLRPIFTLSHVVTYFAPEGCRFAAVGPNNVWQVERGRGGEGRWWVGGEAMMRGEEKEMMIGGDLSDVANVRPAHSI